MCEVGSSVFLLDCIDLDYVRDWVSYEVFYVNCCSLVMVDWCSLRFVF